MNSTARTSTAIVSAPSITYGGVGVVTATVSSTYAVPPDNIALTANGGSVREVRSSTASAKGLYTRTDVFAVAGLTAGNRALSASYHDPAGNFAGSTASGNLHVNKAALTVVANSQSKVYGAALPTLTGALTGVVAGDAITASYSTTATSASDVGKYPITAALNDPNGRLSNYTVTNISGTLTITKANQTIVWATPAPVVYGTALSGAQLDATVSVAGPAAPGALTYTPAAGTVFSTAGSYTLSVFAASTIDYNAASGSVALVVMGPGSKAVGTELWLVEGNISDQVNIQPVGASQTGSTGVRIAATLKGGSTVNTGGQFFSTTYARFFSTTYAQSFTAIRIFGGGGNDNIQMASSLSVNAMIVEGNGNDTATLGDGNNTVTLGNGNDTVTLGNGNNVVTTGNGTDTITAGNGDNLIAAGLGQHTVQVGSGSNILIDGSVTLTRLSTDSLRQVLNDWISRGKSLGNVAGIRSRLHVTNNSSHAKSSRPGRALTGSGRRTRRTRSTGNRLTFSTDRRRARHPIDGRTQEQTDCSNAPRLTRPPNAHAPRCRVAAAGRLPSRRGP